MVSPCSATPRRGWPRRGARRRRRMCTSGRRRRTHPRPCDRHPGSARSGGGVVHNAPNMTGWNEIPAAAMLSERVGCPVVICHDAAAAGYAELKAGAGRGARHLLFITVSTGIGGRSSSTAICTRERRAPRARSATRRSATMALPAGRATPGVSRAPRLVPRSQREPAPSSPGVLYRRFRASTSPRSMRAQS